MSAPESVNSEERGPLGSPAGGPDGAPRKRRGRVWVIVILLLVAAVIAWKILSTGGQAPASAANRAGAAGQAVSVGVVQVMKRDVPYYVSGIGSVMAYYTETVHTRVDGQIMAVHFREGQFVHAGDLLAEIDPRPYQVALAQAEGQLAKDTAAAADAKIDLDRYTTLFKEGVIAKQQLDTQTATVGQAQGAIDADKANVDNERLQLTYCHITAQISGRVGLRLVDPGNIVHAADTNGMLVITQLQPIAVDFTLPEDILPQVQSEMRKQQLTVEAYSRDGNTKLADGKLETIDNQIDPTTGTIKLKAVFSNPDSALWPNQFVNARLFLTVKKNALVIPTAAIQKGSQSPFVYTVNANQEADLREIDVDFSEGNLSVISKGLTAGEQVVVDGQDKLQQGTKVSTHPSKSTPVSGANAGPSTNMGFAP